MAQVYFQRQNKMPSKTFANIILHTYLLILELSPRFSVFLPPVILRATEYPCKNNLPEKEVKTISLV
jgi:hypothetical protein